MSLQVRLEHAQGDFSLECAFSISGGITALFGDSGAGKTTTLDLIAGLRRATAGQVLLDGRLLFDAERRVDVAPHRRGIGYVFQEARLFPHLSVRSNLLYGARRRRAVPGVVQFDEVVALLGLEVLLPRQPATLSGGEARRVAIGRALLSAPQLLLLDEPTAALDEARRHELLDYIDGLRDRIGIPVIHVSHRVDEVRRLADRVVVLHEGKVLNQGSPEQTVMRPEALHREDAPSLPDEARDRPHRN